MPRGASVASGDMLSAHSCGHSPGSAKHGFASRCSLKALAGAVWAWLSDVAPQKVKRIARRNPRAAGGDVASAPRAQNFRTKILVADPGVRAGRMGARGALRKARPSAAQQGARGAGAPSWAGNAAIPDDFARFSDVCVAAAGRAACLRRPSFPRARPLRGSSRGRSASQSPLDRPQRRGYSPIRDGLGLRAAPRRRASLRPRKGTGGTMPGEQAARRTRAGQKAS